MTVKCICYAFIYPDARLNTLNGQQNDNLKWARDKITELERDKSAYILMNQVSSRAILGLEALKQKKNDELVVLMDSTTEIEKEKSQFILRNAVYCQTISELQNMTTQQGHELQLTKSNLITTNNRFAKTICDLKEQISTHKSLHIEQAKRNDVRTCELERQSFQLNEMLSECKVRIKELDAKNHDLCTKLASIPPYKRSQLIVIQVLGF